jgi:rhamnogalacturonan endolyase
VSAGGRSTLTSCCCSRFLLQVLDRCKIFHGNGITKWDWRSAAESPLLVARGCPSNDGAKSTPCFCADILGDWREEVIWRTVDDKALRIYTTPIPTEHRLTTLMHDPQYRLSVAWQNVGYNQPTQPGFCFGDGMSAPPRPRISVPPVPR